MKLKKKGFSIEQIPSLALIFGVGVIILAIIAQITGDVQTQQCSGTLDDGSCYYCTVNATCVGCTYNISGNSCYNSSGTTRAGHAYTDDTASFNVSDYGLSGEYKFANWFPTLGLVIGATIIIGALAGLFAFKGRQ